jgi:tRNA-modifying protein YgfZ
MHREAAPTAASTLLRLEGRDALGVLHRISTAFLDDLVAGQARATLFCDYRGRLLHRAIVAVTGDGAVWLLRDDAAGAALAAHIERHVFREDVRIAELGAGRWVRAVPGGVSLAHGTLRAVDDVPVAVQVDAGSALSVDLEPVIEPDLGAERARIDAGRPRHGHEIAEAFTPYEVHLAHEVHLSKGCYTGQEALLRLVTYRSVRRRLARVGGAGEPPAVPCDIGSADGTVGVLTSAVTGVGGEWSGLAVLRHEACEPGVALTAGDRILGAAAPFPLTRPFGLP